MGVERALLERRKLSVQLEGDVLSSLFASAIQLPHESHTGSDGLVSRKLDEITLIWSAFQRRF